MMSIRPAGGRRRAELLGHAAYADAVLLQLSYSIKDQASISAETIQLTG